MHCSRGDLSSVMSLELSDFAGWYEMLMKQIDKQRVQQIQRPINSFYLLFVRSLLYLLPTPSS